MGVKFGEIDANQILENEYRIGVLEGIVDWILTNNTAYVTELSPAQLDGIRQGVVSRLQKKYPNSGIEMSGK
jgi:hypothetical protein